MKIIALLLLTATLYAGSPFRCDYVVTSEFGSMEGKGGERRPAGHTGIDLWCPDYVIFPILPGVVESIGINEILGKYVIIRHSDILVSVYGHGSTIYNTAAVGSVVTTETPIMLMGSTGYSDGVHLHLECIEDGVHVDPVKYLGEK